MTEQTQLAGQSLRPATIDPSAPDVARSNGDDRNRTFRRAGTADPHRRRATYQAAPVSRREQRAAAATTAAAPGNAVAPETAAPEIAVPESAAPEIAAPQAPATQAKSWRFPALDGLRGIAVVSVMLYHTNWSVRGLFGVDVFFVVSGFLITLLLLREVSATGRVRVGSFFVRRVKRLIPALLITLALVLAAAWWLTDLRTFTEIADRAWWTVWQAANWSQIADGTAYWDATGQIKPLAQMWSLSITEQFYLVWPFLIVAVCFLCRRRPGVVAVVLIVFTAAAAAVSPLLIGNGEGTDRLYLGTDARAVAFVAGAAAAAVVVWIRGRSAVQVVPSRGTRIGITALSSVALVAVVGASLLATSYHDVWLYQGGMAAVGVAAAVLVATLCFAGNALMPFFSFGLFRGVGVISYSVFLLHLPVFWALQLLTPTIAPLMLFVVGGSLTCLLAAFLHHGITERIRKTRWNPWIAIPALAVSVALVAAGSYFLPLLRAQQAAAVTIPTTDADMPTGISGGRPLVLTLGDSLANDLASTLIDNGSGAVAVVDAGQGGCGVVDDTAVRATSGYVWDTTNCPDWRQTWKASIAAQPTDAILVHLGWDAGEHLIDGTWMGPKDPEFQTIYAQTLDEVASMVEAESSSARILLVLDRPTDGIISDPTVTAAFNQLLVDAAARHPSIAVADLGAALCGTGTCRTTDGAGRELFLPDNVHLSPSGRDFIAPWLEQSVRDALLGR